MFAFLTRLRSRPYVAEAGLLLGVGVATYFIQERVAAFDRISHFLDVNGNGSIDADDLMWVFLSLCIGAVLIGVRKMRSLSAEVQARAAEQRENWRLARHDEVTGIANRRFFNETLDRALASGEQTAVLVLDLNKFKMVNDLYGHAAGDAALREFARRVSSAISPAIFVARIGGDEFGVVQASVSSREEAVVLARTIVDVAAKPLTVGGATVTIGVAVGVAVASEPGTGRDEILHRADLALYRAK